MKHDYGDCNSSDFKGTITDYSVRKLINYDYGDYNGSDFKGTITDYSVRKLIKYDYVLHQVGF